MVLEITEAREVGLLHFSALPFHAADIGSEEQEESFRLVEITLSGLDRPLERHGTKYTVTAPGYRLRNITATGITVAGGEESLKSSLSTRKPACM